MEGREGAAGDGGGAIGRRSDLSFIVSDSDMVVTSDSDMEVTVTWWSPSASTTVRAPVCTTERAVFNRLVSRTVQYSTVLVLGLLLLVNNVRMSRLSVPPHLGPLECGKTLSQS